MISAVDLLKGIAVGAGLKNIIVEGADGTLETNYEGKAGGRGQLLYRMAMILPIFMWKRRMKWDIRAVWKERSKP